MANDFIDHGGYVNLKSELIKIAIKGDKKYEIEIYDLVAKESYTVVAG